MRLLIYILALMSAFFVSNLHAQTVVPDGFPTDTHIYSPYYPPKTKIIKVLECWKNPDDKQVFKSEYSSANIESCMEFGRSFLPNDSNSYWKKSTINSSPGSAGNVSFGCSWGGVESSSCDHSGFKFWYANVDDETQKSCPPDQNPDYIYPFAVAGDIKSCHKPIEETPEPNPDDSCPAGYHSMAVSKALGSSECLPKECPAKGTGENLSSTPMTGGVPFSGGGMYCNDGCAYSVNAEQISSNKYAVGTSQGAACGDKPYDNKKLADEGDTDGCATATNGEVDILTCPDANPTTPEPDPIDNDDSKVDEDETPETPKENCAEGDETCNLKNIETEIENSSNKIIDNDNELHNKKIDADTKNTQAILNIMESVDTSILSQTSQDDRLHAVTISKFNELIDAVNGLETGGSAGGSGNGNGTGNGDGDGDGEGDCDPSTTDCVPIENAEIPSETVNLDQYADQYDDWLPNAELPQEKCITLTTGLSTCFSFEAFILLFQGISGLIVIGALMHSARIIAGAV